MSNSPSPRATVARNPRRGVYDRETILAILREAWMAHVGVIDGDAPIVIPMASWVYDGRLWVHGSPRSRLIQLLAGGTPACLSVTLLDGLVLARSAYHHSMNYRSVVLHGVAQEITDPALRDASLASFVNKVQPGRADLVRAASAAELKATTVLAFDVDDASAKIRAGGPIDAPGDLDRPVWAGVIPLSLRRGEPIADG